MNVKLAFDGFPLSPNSDLPQPADLIRAARNDFADAVTWAMACRVPQRRRFARRAGARCMRCFIARVAFLAREARFD